MSADWTQAKRDYQRLSWLLKVRPQPLAVLIAGLVAPRNRRRLVQLPNGMMLYLDPLTQFGEKLLQTDSYEPETEAIFREQIGPGFTVLDVGANEGYFSILAAKLAGSGHVFAIEPQRRCIDILQRNLEANKIGNCTVLEAALGSEDGVGELLLMPAMNTGASSLVRKYRWSNKRQPVRTMAASTLFHRLQIERADFIKVDVEGYEPEVVEGLLPLIEADRVGAILVDFHHSILKKRGIHAEDIHRKLIAAGMRAVQEGAGGYRLYLRSRC